MELRSSQQYPVTGKGAQTETPEIPPECKVTLLTAWMADHGNTLPRQVGESLSLQILKTLSDLL